MEISHINEANWRNKMEEQRFQRLRWNSPWLILHAPAVAFGTWCLLQQIWNGFLLGTTIAGLIFVGIGLTVCLCCLETVHMGEREVQLKLGPIILRRIPVVMIQTMVRTYVTVGKGGSLGESLIILSLRSVKELRKRGGNTLVGLDSYYDTHFFCGFMPRSEGLWLYYSKERMEQLQAALPGVTEFKRR